MIKVIVELHPFGSEADKRVLGEMIVWNDGTGSPSRGNYKFWFGRGANTLAEQRKVRKGDVPPKGEVRDFPRKSYSVFELLKRCLNSTEAR